jgi:PAS domain S-box-containing protein
LTSVGDAVISTDAQGRIVFANPVAQSLLQWPEAEILGRHLDEVFRIINEDSRATVESPVAKVLREGAIVGLANHTVLIARDGTEIPIDDSGAPIRGESGAIEGTVLVFRDVAARRREEATSHLLASIVESSDDAIISKDLSAVITSWNKGAARMFEYSAEEAIGQPIALIAAPERVDEMPGILERIKQGARIDHFETVRRTKSGKLVNVSLTISPLRDTAGRIVGASKIARDISERVRAAEQMASLNALLRESNERLARANDGLQESEQRFRRLADGAPVMIWVAGLDKKYTWLNAVWLKFTGRAMEQELGDAWTERIHPDDRRRWLSTYSENFDRRESFSIEYRLLRHDGEWRWLLDCGMPLQGPEGTFAGYVGSCIDITERIQNEEERANLLARERAARTEAERANRLKDEFLATVSHELRTPLAAVLGWAQLLQDSNLDESSRSRALKAIDHNAKMQAKLLEDILDVSRVVSGKLLLEMQRVELLNVIEGALESIRPAAESKSISMESVFDAAAGVVEGDPERLEQVLRNVLSNAVKFTPQGGRVEVRLERREGFAEIRVQDSGVGIAEEFLPHVFEPFRQADASASRRHGGLGLGLAIVQHVVDLHGGSVHAHSDGPGTGAAFTIRLPLLMGRERQKDESGAASGLAGALRGLRVLIVEDNKDTRELLTVILGNHGAEVRTAASTAAALESFLIEKPHVLVCDIGLPGEDGYGLIRRIRSLKPEEGNEVPALALSAYTRLEDRQQALAAGFQIHLPKPVNPTVLTRAIADLAAGHVAAVEEVGIARDAHASFRIMVVDDAKDVANIFTIVLQDLGHEVHTFYDGLTALNQISSLRPNVVFSDISMRGMSGYELAKRIRATPELERILLVAMTGFDPSEIGGEALRAGFDYHLVKPISVSKLKEFFRELAAKVIEQQRASGIEQQKEGGGSNPGPESVRS